MYLDIHQNMSLIRHSRSKMHFRCPMSTFTSNWTSMSTNQVRIIKLATNLNQAFKCQQSTPIDWKSHHRTFSSKIDIASNCMQMQQKSSPHLKSPSMSSKTSNRTILHQSPFECTYQLHFINCWRRSSSPAISPSDVQVRPWSQHVDLGVLSRPDLLSFTWCQLSLQVYFDMRSCY